MYICRKQNHSDLRARKRKAGFSECRFSFALNLVVFNQRVFKLSLGAAKKKGIWEDWSLSYSASRPKVQIHLETDSVLIKLPHLMLHIKN